MVCRIGGLLLLMMSVFLTGCGLQPGPQRAAWRGQAENECLARKLVRPSAYAEPMRPINGPGACGMDHPFRITALELGNVTLKSRAVLACPTIATVDKWLEQVVQPAAATYYGMRVAEVHIGSYSCRAMNNQRGGRASEHSYGNAVDLMGLTLADGRKVSVEHGWRGEVADQEFLRTIFVGACEYFSTVLAPGSDMFHYNHIHMDLARHSKGRRICKPVLKWSPQTPLLQAGMPQVQRALPTAAAAAAYDLPGPQGRPTQPPPPPRTMQQDIARQAQGRAEMDAEGEAELAPSDQDASFDAQQGVGGRMAPETRALMPRSLDQQAADYDNGESERADSRNGLPYMPPARASTADKISREQWATGTTSPLRQQGTLGTMSTR